tara:strand:- start:1171 stop:2478 length:1308 start_codon:yes stop_codon:yes gene_type:complete
MAETIVAKRELGEGKWDKVLKRKMVELSVADDYNDAKEEWIATGEVWWGESDEIPDWVENSQMGVGKCLCGHIVVYHFEIINTENGVRECVGSDHINTYLIMRAIAEEKQMPIDAITDEQIQEWINVRVKSMKAEAWWKRNGTSFELMFNEIKEMDLYYHTRVTDYAWDNDTSRNEPVRKLVKRGSGAFGSPNYEMASIVWRWNHPDNPKAQTNTTGYPNDNLMKDLALFYVQSKSKMSEFVNIQIARSDRKDEVTKEREERRLRVEQRETERIAREEEERRIYNLPENIEARRLAAEQAELRRLEQQLINQLARTRREEQKKKQLKEARIRANEVLSIESKEFNNACSNYGIPVFDASFGQTTWEINFLVDIKERMLKKKELSRHQIQTLAPIIRNNMATEKQLSYLKDLGYKGVVKTKKEASKEIEKLTEMKE